MESGTVHQSGQRRFLHIFFITVQSQIAFFLFPGLVSAPSAGAPVSAHGVLSLSAVLPGDSVWGGAGT